MATETAEKNGVKEGTTNRVEEHLKDKSNEKKIGSYGRFYGRARKAGGGSIPVEVETPDGKITLKVPLPVTTTTAGCAAEAREKGYGYTLPTKGMQVGKHGIAKDASGKMKGDIAAEALTDLLDGELD